MKKDKKQKKATNKGGLGHQSSLVDVRIEELKRGQGAPGGGPVKGF